MKPAHYIIWHIISAGLILFFPAGSIIPGNGGFLRAETIANADVNNDSHVDLADAVISLHIASGISVAATIDLESDINNDQRIGIVEAIYILQHISGQHETGTKPKIPTEPFEINVSSPPEPVDSNVSPVLNVFAGGLSTPWGMAFLPDGEILVTEKSGSLVVVSADGSSISNSIAGVPAVDFAGQGGLLDVAIDPAFDDNRRVYLSFSEAISGEGNGTAVARGELNAALTALQNVAVIFRQAPKKTGTTGHYGSRLAFGTDGTLFIALGDRQSYAAEAQSLDSQLGKVVRINTDGTIPSDNPFYSQGGNTAAIWSYGHRNIQAAGIHPSTGDLWVAEHGPQGGDEVNLALPGLNYGWPNVSYGCNYGAPVGTACRIGGGVHESPYIPPLAYWYPVSTAPGGMVFYTGDRFPEWQGSLFVGGLAGKTLWRLVLNGNAVIGIETFFTGQYEIRDIRQGPDGRLYLLSRNTNQILRIER